MITWGQLCSWCTACRSSSIVMACPQETIEAGDLRNGTVTVVVVSLDWSVLPELLRTIFAEIESLAARALVANLSRAVQHLRAAQKIKRLVEEAWWN